jgi:hypothetical protein
MAANGLAQGQRFAAEVDQHQRVEPDGLRRGDLQVQFQHAAGGHPVVAGGVDLADQAAEIVGTGQAGQQSEHLSSLPAGGELGFRRV